MLFSVAKIATSHSTTARSRTRTRDIPHSTREPSETAAR